VIPVFETNLKIQDLPKNKLELVEAVKEKKTVQEYRKFKPQAQDSTNYKTYVSWPEYRPYQ